MSQTTATPEMILDFWYSDEMKPAWFNSTPEIDQKIKDQFEDIWEEADKDEYSSWLWSPEGCLALAIIYDQFPLNMFRGDIKAFKTEDKAVSVAKHAIEKGFNKKLPENRLMFLYMPLMHSENMDDQDLSVEMFESLPGKNSADYARHHRNIVKNYGCFPHRNAIFGRESTPEEIEYLNSDGAFKG